MPHSRKIFHGPVNIADAARSMQEIGQLTSEVCDLVLFESQAGPYERSNGFNLKKNIYSRARGLPLRLSFFIFCLFRYDVFVFYFGRSLLWGNIDLPILKLFRKKIIQVFCGSEVRLISVERKRNIYHTHLKINYDHPKYDLGKKIKIFWHGLWCHKIIAMRDKYDHVSGLASKRKIVENIWINNALTLKELTSRTYKRDYVVIVHCPSEPLIKGTQYVDRAIEQLKKSNVKIRYIKLQNKPHSKLLKFIERYADIVIDQMLLGTFGRFSAECMALGKPVVCYVLDDIIQKYCPDLPIISANIDNLPEKLLPLIESKELREEVSLKSRQFAENRFNINDINDQLYTLITELY